MRLKYIGFIILLFAIGALFYGSSYIFSGSDHDPDFGLYNLACGIIGLLGIIVMFVGRKRDRIKRS